MPKVAAKAAPAKKSSPKDSTSSYSTEVRSTAVAPIKVWGKVSQTKDGSFKILAKRPRSPKEDAFVLPKETVYAAEIGDNGWILTDHPDFEPSVFTATISDAEISKDEIWGVDPKTGNDVFVNRSALAVAVRQASYAE